LSILRHTAAVLAVHGLVTPLNVIAGIVIARALGAEGKGMVVLLTGLSAVLVLIAGLGAPSGAAYLAKQDRFPRGTILGTSIALAAVATLVCGLGLWAGAQRFVDVFLGASGVVPTHWVWIAFAAVLPGAVSALLDVLLIVEKQMRAYAVKQGVMAALNAGLTAGLVWVIGVDGALWAQVGMLAIPAIGVLVWLRRRDPTYRLGASRDCAEALLRTGLQQYGVSLVALVAKRADAFLIAALLSVRQAGLFSLAYVGFSTLNAVVRAAMWPTVARHSDDAEGARRLAAVTRAQLLAVTVMAVIAALVAPYAIRLAYGPDFAEATNAVRLMLPAAVLSVLTLAANAYYTSIGAMSRLIVPATVAMALQIVSLTFLLPRLGIEGGSIAFTANQCVQGVWAVHAMSRDTGLPMADFVLPRRSDAAACVDALRGRRGAAAAPRMTS
jgi:O-antigen/teichoic acid export membrane protein